MGRKVTQPTLEIGVVGGPLSPACASEPLITLFALPVVSFAQTTFQEKLTVSYVEIPVTVVGRDLRPLRGLTQRNFEVYEEGDKRAIESFDAIDLASSNEGPVP